MVLEGDPQADHGIAAGPAARDVVCHGRHAVARIHRQARTGELAWQVLDGCKTVRRHRGSRWARKIEARRLCGRRAISTKVLGIRIQPADSR